MKRGLPMLAALTVAIASRAAADEEPRALFDRAAVAVAENRPAEAISLYAHILALGYRDAAVYYNLGCAARLMGDDGAAMLNFRRAACQAPRDRDIRKAVRRLADDMGLPHPPPPVVPAAFGALRVEEWVGVGVAACWVAALLAALRLAGARWRGMREAAVFTALVILTAGGGMLAWRAAGRRPEAVVTAADTSARIAPAGEAPVSAEIPRGSVVRLAEEAPGWVKVVGADRSGWLPQSAVTRVRL